MISVSSDSKLSGLSVWLRDKTAVDVIFLCMAGAVSFYLVALLSYDPFDNTAYSISFPRFATRNMGGVFGAKIAGFLIYQLGIVSYFLALAPLKYTCRVVLNHDTAIRKSSIVGWFGIFLSLAWFTNFYDPNFYIKGVELPSAGAFGIWMAELTNEWLGQSGSFIAFTVVGLTGLTLVVRQSVLGLAFRQSKRVPALFRSLMNFRKKTDGQPVVEPKMPTPPTMDSTPKKVDVEKISSRLSSLVLPPPKVEKAAPAPAPKAPSTKKKGPSTYTFPAVSILNKSPQEFTTKLQYDELEKTGALLVETLAEFGVNGVIIAVKPGPVVTVFEFQPEAGIKQSKVMSLVDDLALALHVDAILINPVTDKRALGIQVPNRKRKLVSLGDVVDSASFENSEGFLTFAMGESLSGEPVNMDISTMPHLLVAGATGSGKSVAVNALLCSVLMKASPDDVRMILVDPKMLELSIYEGIPHLLMPVVTEPQRAGATLKWAVLEMERRYKLMQLAQVRNIAGFNEFWESATPEEKEELTVETKQFIKEDFAVDRLPLILIVIDELADLMLTAPKEVESLIQRLAQKARASGIHLVLATQRPSVDIITGVIKANLPCRAAFQVVSKHDSRTILDQMGAEKLLGKGDMLLQRPGVNRLERIQGAFVSDKEVIELVGFVKNHASPADYDNKLIEWIDRNAQPDSDETDYLESADGELDEKYDLALEIARQQGQISASFLQRQLKIGYNRAARIVETMERQGLIGAPEGSKPRQWIGNI